MNNGFYGFPNILGVLRATAFRAIGKTGATAGAALAGGTLAGPPTSGLFDAGDVVIAQNGQITVCTAAGNPGTWRTLAPFSWIATSANYTLGSADSGILVDASGGDVAVTLPTAAGQTSLYAVKRTDSSAHAVSVATVLGQTIDGFAALALSTAEQVYLLGSDGANWSVAAAFYPSPLTTKGDLAAANTAALPVRVGVGSDGQVLTADSTQTAGVHWAAPTGGATSPLTTKGDVWGYSSADARVPVGADGLALVADSTQSLGVRWGAPQPSSLLVLLPNPYNFIDDGPTDNGQPPDFITLASGDVIGVGGL